MMTVSQRLRQIYCKKSSFFITHCARPIIVVITVFI